MLFYVFIELLLAKLVLCPLQHHISLLINKKAIVRSIQYCAKVLDHR